MLSHERRRQHLGRYSSAALPLVWAELARRGWSHARLATELKKGNAHVAQMLYGVRRPGRDLAVAVHRVLGTPIESWSAPCPKGWRPHRDTTSRKRAA